MDGPSTSGLTFGRAGNVRMAAALPILGLLREFGLKPSSVLVEQGFPPRLFEDPENRVPIELLGKLVTGCALRTGCPHFGLLVGERSGAAGLGKVGFIAKYAADVGTALGALVTNLPRNTDAVSLSLHAQPRQTTVVFTLREPEFPGAEHVVDACLAILVRILRELCGQTWRPRDVSIGHRLRGDVRPYHRCLGATVRFGADQNSVRFDSTWLAHPIGHADPDLHAMMLREIRQDDAGPPRTTAEQVRRIIRAGIGNGGGSVADVAQALGLHPRTLNRRLVREGTNYQALRDDVRQAVACQLLRGSDLSIGQIAGHLDFDEPSAFTRAFRRWTNLSPVEWRRNQGR